MRIISLHIYPVKSMRGVAVPVLELDARGPVNDRRFMLVDDSDTFISQRTLPGLATYVAQRTDNELTIEAPNGTRFTVPAHAPGPARRVTIWRDSLRSVDLGAPVAQWLSDSLGVSCRLVRVAEDEHRLLNPEYSPRAGAENTFADGYPALLATTSSLDAFNARMKAPVPMNRFRPNIVIDANTAFEEHDYRALQLGEMVFDAVKPCTRCPIISTDQATGQTGTDALRVLASFRTVPKQGAVFGINLVHRKPGVLRVGDEARVLQAEPRLDWLVA